MTGLDRKDETGQPRTSHGVTITRRQALESLGAAIISAGVIGAGISTVTRSKAEAVAADDISKNQWVMVIDLRRCDGCKKCVDACREMHYLPEGAEWIKVFDMEDTTGGKYYLPRPCMQCENPPCVKVCPVGATYRGADGVTLVDESVCIGCRMCLAACPYQARTFAWNPLPAPKTLQGPSPEYPVPQQQGTAGKCVFCVHNLRMGKLPGCVQACTMDALWMGDLTTDLMTNGTDTKRLHAFLRDNDAQRMKEELNTGPRVYYVLGHGQNLEF